MNVAETAQSLNPSINPNNPNTILEQIINTTKEEAKNPNNHTHINENSTTITNLAFLRKSELEPTPENINKISQQTSSISTLPEEINSQKKGNITKKKTFVGRTKEWAGNVWNSIKKFEFKKIFAKTEYKIFRNANGDLVKIPVKKIPLKKKKEDKITGKKIKISQEQSKIVSNFLIA